MREFGRISVRIVDYFQHLMDCVGGAGVSIIDRKVGIWKKEVVYDNGATLREMRMVDSELRLRKSVSERYGKRFDLEFLNKGYVAVRRADVMVKLLKLLHACRTGAIYIGG